MGLGGGEGPAGSGHMGNSTVGSLAPSPFKLPASYEEAKERKVAAVSDLRNAVKAVRLAPHHSVQHCMGLHPRVAFMRGTQPRMHRVGMTDVL